MAEFPTYEEMGKRVAEEALDRYIYKGKTLREWIDVLAQTQWIPVRDRLPKPFSYVNCTCHSLVDDREDWVVETCYLPQPPDSPYSDWGNIPMLNWGECEVIAWMYRYIPEPYKAESEQQESEE